MASASFSCFWSEKLLLPPNASWSQWFWNDRLWLGLDTNATWADLRNTKENVYPQLGDFLVLLPIAVLMNVIRFFIFDRFIALPLCRVLGVPAGNGRLAEKNLILEKSFQSVTKCPNDKRLLGLAKQLDWSVRRVERWFRRRRNQERPSRLKKFSECSWRFAFYLGAWSYCMYTIPYEPWFGDTQRLWDNYPFHSLSPSMYNLYIVEASFYVSLMMTIFTDVRRKDFIAMIVHHLTILLLFGFSWVCNFTRVGCLILAIHDVSDLFCEAAKMANYAKVDFLVNANFALMAVTWFVLRVVIFPVWILHSVIIVSWSIIGPYPTYYVFAGLLLVLYVLHLYWFYAILCLVYVLINGKLENDNRSDVEEITDNSDETESLNGNTQKQRNNNF